MGFWSPDYAEKVGGLGSRCVDRYVPNPNYRRSKHIRKKGSTEDQITYSLSG